MFWFSKATATVIRFFASILAVAINITSAVPYGINLMGCRDSVFSEVSYSFYGPTVKLREIDIIEKNPTYEMYAAKNEGEYCQIAVRTKQTDPMQVTLSDFSDENGNTVKTQLLYEYSVVAGKGILNKYPDPLIPCENNSMSFEKTEREHNYVFVILITTDHNTLPGKYKASVNVINPEKPDNKKQSFTADVTLNVWNFELPEAAATETAMGLDKPLIVKAHGIDYESEQATELYKKYYDFLLDHHISAYRLPYDILDERADAYMSDPRITSFCIPYGTDEQIRAYYEKLSTNKVWLDKAYFYPIDEPSDAEAIAKYDEICARLERLYPGYNMVTPFYKNKLEDIGAENIALQDGKSNIICPRSDIFSEQGFIEKVRSRVDNGDKVWWYVCCDPDPTSDYCNLFVQQQMLRHRILFWQQKQLDISGMLYWCTDYWCDVIDMDRQPSNVWESAWTTPWTGDDTYGDGVLLYYGSYVGIDGPVSSLRLEAVRDGIEDIAYLNMAQEILGKDAVDKIIGKVTNSLTDYTYSDSEFDNTRILLGKAIESKGQNVVINGNFGC